MPSRQSDQAAKIYVQSLQHGNYPQLSLHSAAANGNLGLVKYALTNGQPATSILNGVQPIHAAASNGNEAVVKMLIENGADVNAPRLPRKFSSDKKAPSISVGTSGSTPLHFAAANGHLGVVELLLICGARPDLTEKRGMTPEQVAVEHGYLEVVELLRSWDPMAAAQVSVAEAEEAEMERPTSAESRQAFLPVPGSLGSSSRLHSSASLSSLRKHSNSLKRRLPDGFIIPNSSESSLSRSSSNPNLNAAFNSRNLSRVSLASLPPERAYSSSDMLRQMSGPTITYSALTHRPTSTSLFDKRRPSLPSVFEKAAHPRTALRAVLGMTPSRPPPLALRESNSDAFAAEPVKRQKGTHRNSLASMFRGRSASMSRHELPSIQTELDLDNARRHASDDAAYQPYHYNYPSPVDTPLASPPLGSPEVPATAPADQVTFAPLTPSLSPDPLEHPKTAIPLTSQIARPAVSSSHPYRPRKASQLSNSRTPSIHESESSAATSVASLASDAGSDKFHDAAETVSQISASAIDSDEEEEDLEEEEGADANDVTAVQHEDDLTELRSPDSIASPRFRSFSTSRHLRNASNSSVGSQHSQLSDDASPETPQQLPTILKSDLDTPLPYPPDSYRSAGTLKARSNENVLDPPSPYLERSSSQLGGRLRNNSVGSTSSNTSRFGLSPYAASTSSPLASAATSSDRLHSPSLRYDAEHLSVLTRGRRSGSTSTEPDLRQIVLNAQTATDSGMSTSPASVSSFSGSHYHYPSSHSTAATSVANSLPSIRDPPASPRKFTKDGKYSRSGTLSPYQVHNMVKEAEQEIFNYNASESSGSKPSLSEQLAAYSEKLALEREVNANLRRQREAAKAKARSTSVIVPFRQGGPYTWEKLGRDGVRTPLSRSKDKDPIASDAASRLSASPHSSKLGDRPFQQGVLDLRRPPAQLLRQENVASGSDTPKLIIPPAVEPQNALRSAVDKIYDSRANALQSRHRTYMNNPVDSSSRRSIERRSISASSDAKSVSSRKTDPSPPPSVLNQSTSSSTINPALMGAPLKKVNTGGTKYSKNSPSINQPSKFDEPVSATLIYPDEPTPTLEYPKAQSMAPPSENPLPPVPTGLGTRSNHANNKSKFGKMFSKVF